MNNLKSASITFRPIALKAILIALMMTLGACETVQPWQRGVLAAPEMQLDSDPLATRLANQVYASKEAASGGASPAGAGCGCN